MIIGDGSAQLLAHLEVRAAHEAACVAQGICPEHRTPMHPVEVRDGEHLIAGHCTACEKYWWYDTKRHRISSMLDHDPATGEWKPPDRGLA